MEIDWPAVGRDYETVAEFHQALSASLYSLAEVSTWIPKEDAEQWQLVTGLHVNLLGKIVLAYIKEDPTELAEVKKL